MGIMDLTDDALIREILAVTRTIALVGASPDPSRDSNSVMRFLIDRGYEVYPVNPLAGVPEIHGRPVYASLEQLPMAVDLVDVFRRSDAAGAVCDEAIAIGAKAVWMQLGVIDESGARRARDAGLKVIMDRCVRIEIRRLGISGPSASPSDDTRDAR
jgi:predicted CoA-binding protein